MNRAQLVIGWLLVVSIAGGIVLRWSTVSAPLVIGVVGVIGLALLVPLVVLAVVALRAGNRLLRVGFGLVLLFYLVTFANPRAVIGCGASPHDDQIRIFEQNVRVNYGDPAAVAGAVAASGADVAVLEEVWPEFIDTLSAQPGLDAYRYRVSQPARGPAGLAIWSRWPLSDAGADTVGGRPFIHLGVQSPYGPFRLVAVHTTAPVDPAAVADWEAQLAYLGTYDQSQPTVLAGDFNATIDHTQFRRLLETGWSDAHTSKGCGFGLTWPANRGIGVPVMRLDHLLVTDHFEVLGVDIGPADGSDHRSVTATVRLVRPPPG
jgi:endonuclease/exonuclease/phosphatase (EEP) superfamily protein YafD